MASEYYVYLLKDPRDGKPFYVGKGKGDRVFFHVRDAMQNHLGVNDKNIDEKERRKISRIQEIINAGKDVIHVIHRSGLDEKTAYEVEAALIDYIPELTNIAEGHDSGRGPRVIRPDERTEGIIEREKKGEGTDLLFLRAVKDYYNSICDARFKAAGGSDNDTFYQILIRNSLNELHYEFLIKDNLKLGIELHTEADYLNKLNDIISTFTGNIRGHAIENRRNSRGRYRPKIIVPNSVGKEECSLIMVELIKMTHDKIIKKCDQLKI